MSPEEGAKEMAEVEQELLEHTHKDDLEEGSAGGSGGDGVQAKNQIVNLLELVVSPIVIQTFIMVCLFVVVVLVL
jgi:hypothetical protein